jgi:hypothetical protein
MGSDNSSLKSEILKIVIDKLLIGAILLGLGFAANHMLEQYRNKESFKTELNKTRVAKIGEVWELLYTFEADVDKLVQEFTKIAVEAKSDQDQLKKQKEVLAPLATQGRKSLEKLVRTAKQDRFWIGDEMYNDVMSYIDVLGELMSAYHNYDVDKINELDKKRSALRKNVKQIRDKLLGEQ